MKIIPTVRIMRVEESEWGTFGTMTICGQAFCNTLEPPDRQNEKNISNIPPGQYTCRQINSPKFGTTFEVKNVPGRSHILFHSGNFVKSTMGCVLLGASFGQLGAKRAILNSGRTFKKFLDIMHGTEIFNLVISEVY